jgi:hypothetical protein
MKKKIIPESNLLKFKPFPVLLFLFTLLSSVVYGQIVEKHKKVSRSFPVTNGTTIQVSNKYGNIHIVPWDQDSVKFEIDLRASDKAEKEVDLYLANIDFDFTATPYYVIAKSSFRDFRKSIWANISDMASTFMNVDYGVEINWMIYLPQSASLKLENKFGNIYLSDYSGPLDITLSNGNLKTNDLSGQSKIALEFGQGSVGNISDGRFTVNYSEFEIKSARKLKLESKSSELTIISSDELDVQSRRDNIIIENAGILKGELNFSRLEIGKLNQEIVLTLNYANLKAKEINSQFRTLNLNSTYSDVDLFMPRDVAYTVSVSYRKSTVKFPEEMTTLTTTPSNKEKDEYLLSGTVGSGSDNGRNLKISADSGNITLYQQ